MKCNENGNHNFEGSEPPQSHEIVVGQTLLGVRWMV